MTILQKFNIPNLASISIVTDIGFFAAWVVLFISGGRNAQHIPFDGHVEFLQVDAIRDVVGSVGLIDVFQVDLKKYSEIVSSLEQF